MTDPIRLGIFGWPVAHSKSPQMHEAAARALGIDLRYERFAVQPGALSQAIRDQHEAGIDGYNLTVPHKETVIALLDEIAPNARAIGAVNTVVRDGEQYVGHNTDAEGLVRSLLEAGVTVLSSRIAIVGAGGAARAAVVGLAEAGAEEISVFSRRPEQADTLVSSLRERVDCALRAAPLERAGDSFALFVVRIDLQRVRGLAAAVSDCQCSAHTRSARRCLSTARRAAWFRRGRVHSSNHWRSA